jgi:hypothetical protein
VYGHTDANPLIHKDVFAEVSCIRHTSEVSVTPKTANYAISALGTRVNLGNARANPYLVRRSAIWMPIKLAEVAYLFRDTYA